MIDDGRLLTLGALGALLVGGAVRGSRAEVTRYPIFALSHEFLDEDYETPKFRNRISNRKYERKARGKWDASDVLVTVTSEDWQKLQAAHRLPKRFAERQKHLDALEGRVPPQGVATLARIRESSGEQKKLAEALLGSLRNEIIERSRGERRAVSGEPGPPGSAFRTHRSPLPARRSPGSRGVIRTGRPATDDGLLHRLDAARRSLKELRLHPAEDPFRHDPRWDTWAFNIKTYNATPPAWVREAVPDDDQIEATIRELATFELDQILDHLQDDLGMDWLYEKWSTTGRQGGWWVLVDRESPIQKVEEAIGRWPGYDPEDVEVGGRTIGVRITDEDYRQEVTDALALAARRERDIPLIRTEVRSAVTRFEEEIRSDSRWQEILDDLPDAEVARLKRQAAVSRKR